MMNLLEQKLCQKLSENLIPQYSKCYKQRLCWSLSNLMNENYQSYQQVSSPMDSANDITIVYNKFCPFAQRALITAIEKQIPATFRKVSLGEKGQYFGNTYRKSLGHDPQSDGKVPILIHGHRYLTESEPVCWYMAQTFSTGSQLIPHDTFQRARMRLLIGKECASIIDLFNKAKLKQITTVQAYQQQIRDRLSDFDKVIAGNYLLGETISLADILIYPWFERWIILQHNFTVGLGQYKRILQWLNCMQKRKSIQQTKKLTNDEYYINRSKKMFAPKL